MRRPGPGCLSRKTGTRADRSPATDAAEMGKTAALRKCNVAQLGGAAVDRTQRAQRQPTVCFFFREG